MELTTTRGMPLHRLLLIHRIEQEQEQNKDRRNGDKQARETCLARFREQHFQDFTYTTAKNFYIASIPK